MERAGGDRGRGRDKESREGREDGREGEGREERLEERSSVHIAKCIIMTSPHNT